MAKSQLPTADEARAEAARLRAKLADLEPDLEAAQTARAEAWAVWNDLKEPAAKLIKQRDDLLNQARHLEKWAASIDPSPDQVDATIGA